MKIQTKYNIGDWVLFIFDGDSDRYDGKCVGKITEFNIDEDCLKTYEIEAYYQRSDGSYYASHIWQSLEESEIIEPVPQSLINLKHVGPEPKPETIKLESGAEIKTATAALGALQEREHHAQMNVFKELYGKHIHCFEDRLIFGNTGAIQPRKGFTLDVSKFNEDMQPIESDGTEFAGIRKVILKSRAMGMSEYPPPYPAKWLEHIFGADIASDEDD